ncbi:uncharacterized protein LOC123527889 [Mercenaria mercenaria]|uniref:uncharacterized protein LOC123527889 n=1 Tax=Mercenaria mercenaria TaxID=6596 RepID=UPI00234F145B|nr:uncharacterized protein LOC123527889 [Mercenaria mercenaria]
MASSKPDLPRDGTMQVTAKEGIAMLKAAGKDTLLEMQGLKEPENDKPTVNRETTMQVTAKEGQSLLAGSSLDPDASTRGQQKKLEEIAEEEAPAPKKPRMSKLQSMVKHVSEAKTLLGAGAPDADALTRGQQKKIQDIQAEKPSPKKPKMSKNTTMAATAKEGTAILEGEKLGDTRQETKSKASRPAGPKRSRTIQKTMEEAQYVLNTDKVDLTEGRRTRSASKPKPAMKKAGTMQVTAKEGKEFLQRGKKGRKAAEKKSEETIDEDEGSDNE